MNKLTLIAAMLAPMVMGKTLTASQELREYQSVRKRLRSPKEYAPGGKTFAGIENLLSQYDRQQNNNAPSLPTLRDNLPTITGRLDNAKQAQLIRGIAEKVQLTRARAIHSTSDWTEFASAYARDLEERARMQDPRFNEDLYNHAEHELRGNQCKGFSCLDDSVWMYDGAVHSDILHECIHILSTPGGLGPFYNMFGNDLNEGATQFFTERVCETLGVRGPDFAVRYPDEVDFVKSLCDTYGLGVIYNAYFKGAVEPLLDDMVKQWTTYVKQKLYADRSKPGFRERNMVKQNKKAEMKDEIRQNMRKFKMKLKWVKARLL